MPRTVPTSEPLELTAGDTWEWDRVFSDFPPSDGWVLTYYFNGPGAFSFAASTSSEGDYFEVRQTASSHASKMSGVYRVLGRVAYNGEAFTVYEGHVRILPNLATAPESVSHAVRTLAVIDAAIEGRLTADLESYQINGRQVTKIPAMELVKLQGFYRHRVWQERNPGKFSRTVEVSFGIPA